MGYESRIYVVSKSDGTFTNDKGFHFAEVIASFNLCCVGNDVYQAIHNSPITDAYIYEGDEEIHEDKYGKGMREIMIPELIRVLEAAEATEHYRRYTPIIGALKAFDLNEWDDLVCLHYGY